jgi:ATP-dependent Clp protease protease subunit
MATIIAHHTGKPLEEVERDLDRDYYMTAEEAKEYGIVDAVIAPRRGVSGELLELAAQM